MIEETLKNIFQNYKGILAADERPASIEKRLKDHSIEPSEENKNKYREMLFSTPHLERTVSGVILSEDAFLSHETKESLTKDYLSEIGISVGVKLDEGLEEYSGELMVTKGLDGLDKKCAMYSKNGANFTKWRSVIPVLTSTDEFIERVCEDMVKYANTAIKNDLTPILEPEVLLSGNHTIEESEKTLTKVLEALLRVMKNNGCNPNKTILKTSFVTAGLEKEVSDPEEVSRRTIDVFRKVGLNDGKGFYGIVFLSGGLSSENAIEYIQKIKVVCEEDTNNEKGDFKQLFTTPVTFSYGRALQIPALIEWGGSDENILSAQIVFTQTLQKATKKYKGTEKTSKWH